MSDEPLLHPPAEVVRTGLPLGASAAHSETVKSGGSGDEIVAGPFASGPPSSSIIPPGSWTRPTAPPYSVVVDVPQTVSAEADEMAYLELPAEYPPLAGVRGGRRQRKKAILWEVIRSLQMPDPAKPGDQGDLPLLSFSLPAAKQTLTQIRHSHHQLARLIATGAEHSECSYITGYTPSYISVLKDDPSFKELVAYYSAQQEHTYIDAIERMRSLGLNTLEVLQTRLEEDDSQFSNRELLEQAELMLIKPMAATRGLIPIGGARAPDGSGSGVQVNVNFIQTEHREPAPTQGDVIDMKPTAKY